MSEQALDLRRSLQIMRRHWIVITIITGLGLGAGAAFAVLNPPMLTSTALVVLPPSAHGAATQGVIASSDPVLSGALPRVQPAMSLQKLQSEVKVRTLTYNLLTITAQGRTAAEAEGNANAVADSYVGYVGTKNSPGGQVKARVLEATTASGVPPLARTLVAGGIGGLGGALIGAIGVLAFNRRDRRLRERDEIAVSIGIPVLASIPVGHPTDAAGWTRLLTAYEPGALDAWSLRGALRHLGLGEINRGGAGQGSKGASLAVLSLSRDPGALALGPQLASFAASLGIRTALVIGPQQDADATATLRAACAPLAAGPSRLSKFLQIAVRDQGDPQHRPDADLTIVVAVVNEKSPRVADRTRTTATVLGVSAGSATAEDLARVAVSAADAGHQIAGILVADPDSTDHTTGRFPLSAGSAARRLPTHLTGIPTETQRWMTQNRR